MINTLWTIQSSKMLHDNKKKTIYYDIFMIKIYDIPIFLFTKIISHPDPTVDRRSGFLPPSLFNSKNLESGLNVLIFDLAPDKSFTLKSRVYVDENPLFHGEYRASFLKILT